MTPEELLKNLEKYSPFQFEGGNERFIFKNHNEIYIDNEFWDNYQIIDTNNGLHIQNRGIMPFPKNVLVDLVEKELCTIVNHDGNKLIEFPDNLRHSAAKGGFFILKSLNVQD